MIAYFQKEYVKTGKFEIRFSKYLSAAFQIRNQADYADFYIIAKDRAEEQYQHAAEFVEEVEKFLSKKSK